MCTYILPFLLLLLLLYLQSLQSVIPLTSFPHLTSLSWQPCSSPSFSFKP